MIESEDDERAKRALGFGVWSLPSASPLDSLPLSEVTTYLLPENRGGPFPMECALKCAQWSLLDADHNLGASEGGAACLGGTGLKGKAKAKATRTGVKGRAGSEAQRSAEGWGASGGATEWDLSGSHILKHRCLHTQAIRILAILLLPHINPDPFF